MHVFRDGQAGEDVFSLRHEANASGHELVGTQVGDVLALEQKLAGMDMYQAEQRLQQRGLAGTIRANNADDLTFMEGQGSAIEDVHARKVAGHQIHRVKQRLALRFPHMNLRAGQRLVSATLDVRFTRIGHMGYRDRTRHSSRTCHTCVVAHFRPPSNLPARSRHPSRYSHGLPDTRRSRPDRSSRSSAGLRPRSCLQP